MIRAVVLGGGMIGATMAKDLAAEEDFDVTVADVNPRALVRLAPFGIETREADLGDAATLKRVVADFDVVIGALPSAMGFRSLRAILEAGKHCVDISFMAEDALALCSLAEERGAIAVTDCGVAPGISNMVVGYACTQLAPCESIEIYVGGLPVERRWPFEYKAAFAPSDVIEEYTRPARLVVGGKVVERAALSEPELLDFPGVGTLEAFNTDGLRSLIATMDVPDMREKTMRYPGHIELMRVLREMGLFSDEPIDVKGVAVKPVDVAGALLFPAWTYEQGEADLTVMRVIVRGKQGGQPVRYQWELLDYYDAATATTSMARTTGYPATAVAKLIGRGTFPLGPGVWPPELPAREPGFVDAVLGELEARGVRCIGTVR